MTCAPGARSVTPLARVLKHIDFEERGSRLGGRVRKGSPSRSCPVVVKSTHRREKKHDIVASSRLVKPGGLAPHLTSTSCLSRCQGNCSVQDLSPVVALSIDASTAAVVLRPHALESVPKRWNPAPRYGRVDHAQIRSCGRSQRCGGVQELKILTMESHEPVHNDMASLLTPKQLTRLSCPCKVPTRSPRSTSHTCDKD